MSKINNEQRLNELKQKFDEKFGLYGIMEADELEAIINYNLPSGYCIITINLHFSTTRKNKEGDWHFGGYSEHLQQDWYDLCKF